MTMMKLVHSHDYNAGDSLNSFDEVFHIVHMKIHDINDGLNLLMCSVRIPSKLIHCMLTKGIIQLTNF